MGYEAIRYEVDGRVATITMNRPEVANAQDTRLIDEIDAAFDEADADDAVRVVILAGEGKHFSSGHDLKALVGEDGADEWVLMRETPEGKLYHEKVMYYDRCKRIHDFRKPTIAAVQGSCVAAGLMLACMCDLIVAAEDAVFSNPVLRMTGAGVELLVEPWELGIRKAKEFLLDGGDHRRAGGLASRTGEPGRPRAELAERTRRARRADLARPARHGPGGEGFAQPHRRAHGQVGLVEVPLHGAPLDAQHGDGPRSARRAAHPHLDEGSVLRSRPEGTGRPVDRRSQPETARAPARWRACGSSTWALASRHRSARGSSASSAPR